MLYLHQLAHSAINPVLYLQLLWAERDPGSQLLDKDVATGALGHILSGCHLTAGSRQYPDEAAQPSA